MQWCLTCGYFNSSRRASCSLDAGEKYLCYVMQSSKKRTFIIGSSKKKANKTVPLGFEPSLTRTKKAKQFHTGDSRAVTYRSTNPAHRNLTAQIGRDGVLSSGYDGIM